MPRYLLSTHSTAGATREPMTDEQMQKAWEPIQALEAEMKSAGAWVFSARLHDPDTATVVRISGDEVVTTDGPFVSRLTGPLDTARRRRLACRMDLIRFAGTVRYWDPAKGSGLAVVDIPSEHVHALGGLRQQRVRGSLAGTEFASNVMPAGGGRLALSVSKAMMAASHLAVGDHADVEISRAGSG